MVKADAYGHGLVPCARAALAGGATWLGVAQLDEGLALRRAGVGGRLLSWLHVPGEPFAEALRRRHRPVGLGPVVPRRDPGRCDRDRPDRPDPAQGRHRAVPQRLPAGRLAGPARRRRRRAGRGLGRGRGRLVAPGLGRRTTATRRSGPSASCSSRWPRRPSGPGCACQLRHLANSAATLTDPAAHFDLVRPGLAVYGLSPVPDLGDPAAYRLTPAMTLRGRLAGVKRVPAGEGVSYGHEYHTEHDTTLALIPLGYADGVPRSAGQPRRDPGRRAPAPDRRPGLHGPVRRGPGRRPGRRDRATGRRRGAVRPRLGAASRPRRTGPRRPGPSPTRSSPGSARGCPRTYVGEVA